MTTATEIQKLESIDDVRKLTQVIDKVYLDGFGYANYIGITKDNNVGFGQKIREDDRILIINFPINGARVHDGKIFSRTTNYFIDEKTHPDLYNQLVREGI